jgi:hypothetical protein
VVAVGQRQNLAARSRHNLGNQGLLHGSSRPDAIMTPTLLDQAGGTTFAQQANSTSRRAWRR